MTKLPKGSNAPKTPVLNPNSIKTTLEEAYNDERHKQKLDIKNRINRFILDANPAAYGPLTAKVDSLKSQAMSPGELKELVGDIAAVNRDLARENKKKEEKNQIRIADLEARLEKLKVRRDAESALTAQIKEAQKVVDAKLKEDNKIAKDKFMELCKSHKASENKKEKMETDGVNTLFQMTNDLIKDSIKFIKIHNLYTMIVNDVLAEFTRRFNEHVEEVDVILQQFPLGRFLLSFSHRESNLNTEYLTTYINEVVTLQDCSINTLYKERLREVFVNFMLAAIDCLLILANGITTRITFGDMLCYFTTAYFHRFGRDQSFTDLMTQYTTKLNEVVHKKKVEETSAEETPVEAQPVETPVDLEAANQQVQQVVQELAQPSA